jgi:SAM-dependent methyltransferase
VAKSPARDAMKELRELFETRPDVITEVSPDDRMYRPHLRRDYFVHGHWVLRSVKLALLAARKDEVRSILDLPCGYGRVLRQLAATFPEARLTACDLDRGGVEFCARVFGAAGVYSNEDPAKIELDGKFDLIYCGSLLTHVDADRWSAFLELFCSRLERGGVVVFTASGRRMAENIRSGERLYGLTEESVPGILADYEETGFGYRNWPDLDNYGLSLSTPGWVCRKLEEQPSLHLLTYSEDMPQDMVSCRLAAVGERFRGRSPVGSRDQFP